MDLPELFTETIALGDVLSVVYTEIDYSTKNWTHVVKIANGVITGVNAKNLAITYNTENRSRSIKKRFTRRYGVILSPNSYIHFVSYQKLSEFDDLVIKDIFENSLKVIDEVVILKTESDKREICNKSVRTYNSNIAFSYLDDIFKEDKNETRDN